MTKVGDLLESFATQNASHIPAGTTGLSRNTYSTLFNVLSTALGAGWASTTGDGATTFDLPSATPSVTGATVYYCNFNQ